MVKKWAMRARALSLGLVGAALAGCASVPASITGVPPELRPTMSSPYEEDAAPRVADARANLQCVPFARAASGVSIYGNANTWWRQAAGRYPRSSSPSPGSVLVVEGYNNPRRGHVAVVRRVVSERMIIIDHANWLNSGEVSVNVPVMDVSPANDWSEVRVWHIPGGHWGGRVYRVEGFIHPFTLHAAMS